MKKIFYILIPLFLPLLSIGQPWKINPAGTKISFVIKNAGFSVDGTFSGLSGEIVFDPKELPKSSFNTSIDAASINTGINKRNEHLKKDEYFDVAKYPKISFKTKSIAATPDGKYVATGELTIKGKSKELKLPFTFAPTATGGVFQGSFTINRRDFNVGGSSLIMSDEAVVTILVAVVKQ